MKKWVKDTYGILISVLLVVIFLGYIVFDSKKVREYHTSFDYIGTRIQLKIFTKDPSKGKRALKDIEQIYKKYDRLIDRKHSYDGVKNLYYIKNNKQKSKEIKIDSELYKIIDYGKKMSEKSKDLLTIQMGEFTDIWNTYKTEKKAIPNAEEHKDVRTDMQDIVLLGNNMIVNNHVNLDVTPIIKGYVTEEVKKYLKKENIPTYLMNTGGTIVAGEHYNGKIYRIALEDPGSKKRYYQFLNVKNTSVSTKSMYDNAYVYENKYYPIGMGQKSLFPPTYMKAVTIITKDAKLADALSSILFLMPVKEGKEYIEKYPAVDAIFYQNDGTMVKTENILKWEK